MDNKSFTEAFCENIDKPELECNGSCAIASASKDLERREGPQEYRAPSEITFFVSAPVDFVPQKFILAPKSLFSYSRFYFPVASDPEVPPPRNLFLFS